jgi:signal transduction histidine kinase
LTLRARLLLTLAGTAAIPILLFAWAVDQRLDRVADEQLRRRLGTAAASLRPRLEASRTRLVRPLQRVLAALPELGDAPTAEAWSRLAEQNALDALELVGAGDTLLLSRQWPAGEQLRDDDRVLDEQLGLRLEKVAQGHAFVERLLLTAELPAAFRGKPARLRGGVLLDEPLLLDWSAAAGAELALVRAGGEERWSSAGSALAGMQLPSLEAGAGGGEVTAGGRRVGWAAQRLGPQLFAVAADAAAETAGGLASDVARLAMAFAGLAALLGVAAALLLSSGIVRPLERLARASQRVAAGELSAEVPVEGAHEIAALGRSFNEMVDDLRRAQQRVAQAGRVAVWRDLARRLAHELKNPLFPIQIAVETLRRAWDRQGAAAPGPEFRKLFEELTTTLLAELLSLRRIVDSFAGFARMPEPKLEPTDLNALVDRVLDLHAPHGSHVRIERRLAPDLPLVPADADLLSRALGNLVRNALEAMPEGGVLTLTTRSLPRQAEIAVADTGPGLDTAQLFRPYHTTKPDGSGLGLVITQGIVSDHRGELDVESAPQRGTTFRLRLPVAAAA